MTAVVEYLTVTRDRVTPPPAEEQRDVEFMTYDEWRYRCMVAGWQAAELRSSIEADDRLKARRERRGRWRPWRRS